MFGKHRGDEPVRGSVILFPGSGCDFVVNLSTDESIEARHGEAVHSNTWHVGQVDPADITS